MKYDYESTKARSPNVDPFYFCGNGTDKGCGQPNSPYMYKDTEEFKRQLKNNRCPKCLGREDNLFGEKTKVGK